MSAFDMRLRYTLYLRPLPDSMSFSTSISVRSSRSESFLYTELSGMRSDDERFVAVSPRLMSEKSMLRDSGSARTSITFWVMSYFFSCGSVSLFGMAVCQATAYLNKAVRFSFHRTRNVENTHGHALDTVLSGQFGLPAMSGVEKAAGVALIAISAILAFHTVLEPWYHTSTDERPYSPVWDYINPLSAIAIGIGAWMGIRLKRALPRTEHITREELSVNAQFYGIVFVAILFFWNWGNVSNLGTFYAVSQDAMSVGWIMIDALLPIFAGTLGVRLVRGPAARP